jgi:hypothetical protein
LSTLYLGSAGARRELGVASGALTDAAIFRDLVTQADPGRMITAIDDTVLNDAGCMTVD